ncbi:unnamed protein product [Ambrosiozyma monospora]|uniref:Unnamed protein product n=1 Tax=Ambrosiozyma monospora TaxID=43982 RepID=A0ACB5SZI0_AMBMO|nr:unnamed protein product [Ambrosiozyma monospora]
MHEVINISVSPTANNTTTHFNNLQESNLHLTESTSSSPYDPDVHFTAEVLPLQGANYYPRTLLWDYEDGYGALGQFEYFEDPQERQKLNAVVNANTETSTSYKIIRTGDKVSKNSYQKALDANLPTQGKLNTENTKYWSDFSRVLYKPSSMSKLGRWDYDTESHEGILGLHPERKFEDYSVGVNEFKENSTGDDFVDENFRNLLENCDLANGVNLLTEVDSGWGGFSSSLLDMLRDTYVPKLPILTWGFYQDHGPEFLLNRQLSRIRATVSLVGNSSLFLPLSDHPASLPSWVDYGSLWHTSTFSTVPFEFMNSIGSQKQNRYGLSDIVDGLILGESKRNVVSHIRFLQDQTVFDVSASSIYKHIPANGRNRRE